MHRPNSASAAAHSVLLWGAAVAIIGFLSAPAVGSELRFTPVVKAVAKARPAVVNIHGHKTVNADAEAAPGETVKRVNGMGTGVVIDPRGYIVTNFHVVEGVRRIRVTTAQEDEYVAQLVAHDSRTDLAVIKVPSTAKLPVIDIGASSDLMVGEPVIAVGNAFGYEHTVTEGIVSALHRTVQVNDTQQYENLIQTSADINPGNSGGPLLNIDGQMIGINVAVRVGAQGIGFAIPVDDALRIAGRLLSAESIGQIRHGIVGRGRLDAGKTTFRVEQAAASSPAARCGLQPGDVITHAGSVAVRRQLDIERAALGHRHGDELPLTVFRDGRETTLALVLEEAATKPKKGGDIWESLGVDLEPTSARLFQKLGTHYRGGLKISAIRPGGPADNQGIRVGDLLVGMHRWETVTLENVNFILGHPEVAKQPEPILFYVLRGNDTLYGRIDLRTAQR